MKITNTSAKLAIATNPSAPQDEDRQYLDVKFLTNLIFNYSVNKQESKYYKNFGTATQTITGQTYSISASIDVDLENPAHIYLCNLARERNILNMNNNWFKIYEPNPLPGSFEAGYSFGKSAIEFKNNFPSGAVDEIVKLEFDIFPQDDVWEYVPAKALSPLNENEIEPVVPDEIEPVVPDEIEPEKNIFKKFNKKEVIKNE